LGGWFRVGLVANQRTAWVHALLCGPDLPTIALVDVEAPLPEDPWVLRGSALEVSHSVGLPLQTYRVELRGRGQAYPDPSALLRGEAGSPVEVTMNLEWATDGIPYKYRVTTRYEIPCTVSGTVTVDDKAYRIDSVPGQRDHSWGVRDWWSMDWMWSALHLDDGSHLHGLQVKVPNIPPMGIGYLQSPDRQVVELQTVNTREAFAGNALPLHTTLRLGAGGGAADIDADIDAGIDMVAHAPVLLTSIDGRVSHFPRAWVSVSTADGRAGVGWMEWNRNQA
jgi:hypothetical protein